MNTAFAHGLLPLGPLIIMGVFFALYQRFIWPRTTGEPWTYILRRSTWLSLPIMVTAVAILGVVTWQVPWWLAWLPVFFAFVIALWAHIDWAGLRAGEIHRPTAWRCAEELRSYSTKAADWLEQTLKDKGHDYQKGDRHDDTRMGLDPRPRAGRR